jgi:hypothetical protein
MEYIDPIEFSIWGKVGFGKISDYRKWVANKLNISQITAQKLFVESAKAGELVIVYSELIWSAIPNRLEKIPEFIDRETVVVATSGIYPSEDRNYCGIHKLYYRMDDCPICSNRAE